MDIVTHSQRSTPQEFPTNHGVKPAVWHDWTYCYRLKISCPICKKPDHGCSIRDDRGAVYCRTTPSQFVSATGLYWHPLTGEAAEVPPAAIPQPQLSSIADIERRHSVYSAFLDGLTLLPKHRADLGHRGLDDAAIEASGIKSIPTMMEAVYLTDSLATQFDLARVPGFYSSGGNWGINIRGALTVVGGFYIPIRDHKGRIQALQFRQYDTDKGKYRWFSSTSLKEGIKADPESLTSSGSPAHFINVARMRKQRAAVVTEGALKAIVISHFLGCGVIGFGGLNAPEGFREKLKTELPEIRRLEIAFDADWQNRAKPQIKAALLRLIDELREDGFNVNVRTWNQAEGKGLDDVLLNRRLQEVA